MAKKKKKKGLAPGTVVYTGDVSGKEVKIHFLEFDCDTIKNQDFSNVDTIPEVSPSSEKIHWLDVRGIHDENILRQIGDKYKIHPLVLEDIANIYQRPKFEDFVSGIFISIKALGFDAKKQEITTEQVSIYFAGNLLISFQEHETDLFESVRLRIDTSKGRIRSKGTDYLAFALMDCLVDSYFETLDNFWDIIEDMESKLIENEDTKYKLKIYNIRRELLDFRSFVAPTRELLNKFLKAESIYIKENNLVFVRDLQDHISQVLDTSENYKDTLKGLYDLLMTNVSFKMNQVMKILTTISTIFIPLTFLAGIYGMNFTYMPELDWKYSYPLFWSLMLTITGLMIWFFKRKNWF